MYIVTLKCVIFVFMKVFNNKTQAKGSKKVRASGTVEQGCGLKIIQNSVDQSCQSTKQNAAKRR